MGSTKRHEKELAVKVREELKNATVPLDKIRLTALSRGPGGIRDIGRIFRNMDDDRSGQITMNEFKKGVKDIGCNLTKTEVEEAYMEIDKDDSGSISYEEFLLCLRGKSLNASREKFVIKAFEKLDKDNSGTITVNDLQGVYDVTNHPKVISGEWTEEKALTSFLANFDTPDNCDGTVTRDEFLGYYAGISASIDSDAYFALMMENAWKLNQQPRKTKGSNSGPQGSKRATGLMDALGRKDARNDFSRRPTDLNCSVEVQSRMSGTYSRI